MKGTKLNLVFMGENKKDFGRKSIVKIHEAYI
jgi:hypothetical protein